MQNRAQPAPWVLTSRVRRRASAHADHTDHTYNGRTYMTRDVAWTGGAVCAACARPRRTPPGRGQPPGLLPTAATRCHAPTTSPHRTHATPPRRAPRRCCRPSRRLWSRRRGAPRCPMTCLYLRGAERRTRVSGASALNARDVRPTVGCRGRSASAQPLAPAAQLPVSPERRALATPASKGCRTHLLSVQRGRQT